MKTRKGLSGFLRYGALAVALVGGVSAMAHDVPPGTGNGDEEDVVKLGGLEIRRALVNTQEYVNDKGEATYLMSESFAHGTRSLRLNVKNTTGQPVGLCAEIPLRTGIRHGVFVGKAYVRLMAETQIAPSSECEWNIPVPCVSDLAMDFGDDGGWSFAASTGESVRGTYALHDGGRNHLYSRPYLPRVRRRHDVLKTRQLPWIAISPGLARVKVRSAYRRARYRQEHQDAKNLSDEEIDRKVEKVSSYVSEIVLPDYRNFRTWQDLSGYDLFVIRDTDWPALGETFRTVLPDWVASGGCVAFVGETFEGLPAAGPLGLGRICHCLDEQQLGAKIAAFVDTSVRMQCLRGVESPLESAQAAREAEMAFRGETPFALILLVLSAFTIVAGPVVVLILARKNKRINLLWVFPLVSVLFSIAVAGVCVFAKGIDPELRQFAYTLVDEAAGKVVTVQDDVIMAPFPISGELRYSAQGTLAYSCGDNASAGEAIFYTGDAFIFRHGWTPALWPVVFRTVRVWDISDEAVKAVRGAVTAEGLETAKPLGVVTCPFAGHLQSRSIAHKVERRAAP